MIDTTGRLTRLQAVAQSIRAFGGAIWYVDATNGIDTNTGETAGTAFATIGAAITAAAAGDAINVMAGDYDEVGLALALDGMELWCEVGVHILDSTPGTALLVSGDHCRVQDAHLDGAGATGLQVTGDHAWLENLLSEGTTVGYDIDGSGTIMIRLASIAHTTTGFDVSGPGNIIQNGYSAGLGGATRGYYLSNAAADGCLFDHCASTANVTAGYECIAGTASNLFRECVSSTGDGDRIDQGTNNFWASYVDQMETEHNAHTYPRPDGEGTAGDPVTANADAQDETNAAATTMNYWGEPTVIVAPAVFTTAWRWVGISIFATTTGKDFRSYAYKIDHSRSSARNAGNAWDEGATALTVADGTLFEADDLVWVYSTYKVNGEIQKVVSSIANVVTVVRETSQFGAPNTGLRWDHTTNAAGTEAMYVIHRDDELSSEGFWFDFGASGARDMQVQHWHDTKRMDDNDGVLVRTINGTDSVNNARFSCDIIYEE